LPCDVGRSFVHGQAKPVPGALLHQQALPHGTALTSVQTRTAP